MRKTVYKGIATVFGIGFLPLAPGTWASVLAGAAWFGLQSTATFTLTWQAGLIIISLLAGVYTSGKLMADYGKDPSCVVVDEWAGMWISCFCLPPGMLPILGALIAFRILDIFKPFGIRKAENLPGGWGIMMDDVAAGIMANVVLQLIFFIIR